MIEPRKYTTKWFEQQSDKRCLTEFTFLCDKYHETKRKQGIDKAIPKRYRDQMMMVRNVITKRLQSRLEPL